MSPSFEVSVVMQDRNTLEDRIKKTDRKFRKCSQQMMLLSNSIEQLEQKLILAKEQRNAVFIYNLQLRMNMMEGVQQMMYSYASKLAQELDLLHQRAMMLEGDHLFGSDAESDDEYLDNDLEYALDDEELE